MRNVCIYLVSHIECIFNVVHCTVRLHNVDRMIGRCLFSIIDLIYTTIELQLFQQGRAGAKC